MSWANRLIVTVAVLIFTPTVALLWLAEATLIPGNPWGALAWGSVSLGITLAFAAVVRGMVNEFRYQREYRP